MTFTDTAPPPPVSNTRRGRRVGWYVFYQRDEMLVPLRILGTFKSYADAEKACNDLARMGKFQRTELTVGGATSRA